MSKSRHRVSGEHFCAEAVNQAKTQKWKSAILIYRKANRSDWRQYIVYVDEIVGDKARKVGWGQIMEDFERQTDVCELYSVDNGEPLKVLEPQNDVTKVVLEED